MKTGTFDQVNWGMIGTGNVTELKSGPAFNKIENSRLIAVSNRTHAKAEDYAARFHIPKVYRDPVDLIHDPEVNAVYIATPPGSHMEYALETIRAGKAVYIEKPMALTGEECRIINEAAAAAEVPVYVAYYRRSLPYFKKVKELIDSGKLGKLLYINITQHNAARPEDYDPKNLPWRVIKEDAGGGYFHDIGCHGLDIIFHLFGDPLEVCGKAVNVGGLYEVADTISASLVLPNKLMVNGSWTFVSPEAFVKDRVEVFGEKGKLSFSIFSFKPIHLLSGQQDENRSAIQPMHIQSPLIESIVSELRGEGKAPSTGLTAAVTSRVMDIICKT